MKTININIYKYSELSEKAKEKVRYKYQDNIYIDETDFDGIFKILDYLGIDIREYLQTGEYYLNSNVLDNLTGERAFAYFENNLSSKLRISYTGKKRWEYFKYGKEYRPGKIKPCPFTGLCYDEDYIKEIQYSLKKGYSVKDIINFCFDLRRKLFEQEFEYQCSEEYMTEYFEDNEIFFLKDGTIYRN